MGMITCMDYCILAVICAALIYLRSKKNRGVHDKQDVNSLRVTVDCIMRDGLKKGVCYLQDVRVSWREYGIYEIFHLSLPCEYTVWIPLPIFHR